MRLRASGVQGSAGCLLFSRLGFLVSEVGLKG